MRKLFLPLCLLLSITVNAQKPDKLVQLQQSMAKNKARLDSMQKTNDSLLAKRMDSMDMARFNEQNSRNLNSLIITMKEREQKQKQQMWLRLGFGVLMLGVLIFGLIRKRKKKDIE